MIQLKRGKRARKGNAGHKLGKYKVPRTGSHYNRKSR